jgi:uncharacterized oxidoreductase
MQTHGNHVLITGGGTGIGFAMAEAFLSAGSEVAICGRTAAHLDAAVEKLPNLQAKVCDISKAEDRLELLTWVLSDFANLNVLVNNAGIQRDIDFT